MPGHTSGFVDVLFILLAGVIAALAGAMPLGQLEAEPARVGGGGVSPIRVSDTVLLAVTETGVVFDDGLEIADAEATTRLARGAYAVLLPADADVSHHRVLAVWDTLDRAGVAAGFGVMPRPGEDTPSAAGEPAR